MKKFNLADWLNDNDITQAELARMIETPVQTINWQLKNDKCTGAVKHACLGLKPRGMLYRGRGK
jgi:hypothetical protein